ncbi:hypothetical protein [Maricaulis sp. MIT060901]|uniref:hypothetical protein n=1 Tax=Maricaulis sp. MIT060901 TaxID=3096993 RepID=UPI00399A1D3F
MFGLLTLAMALQVQSPEMRDYVSTLSIMVKHAACAGFAGYAPMEGAFGAHVERVGPLSRELSALAEQLEGSPGLNISPGLDLSYEAQSGFFVGAAHGHAQWLVQNEFQSLREESLELEFDEIDPETDLRFDQAGPEIALRFYNEAGCSDVLSGNAQ